MTIFRPCAFLQTSTASALFITAALIAATLSPYATAEQSKQVGNYNVHYVAFALSLIHI